MTRPLVRTAAEVLKLKGIQDLLQMPRTVRPGSSQTNLGSEGAFRKTLGSGKGSRPNSPGLFSTEAGSTTGGWVSRVHSPSSGVRYQTLRTAESGGLSAAKSEKRLVSRKLGAWF